MEKLPMGFVPFQNYQLAYVTVGKEHYVAVRPMIESIGLEYDSAIEGIKAHHDLGKYYTMHKFLANDNKMRDMACLPYRKIYGWLMMIDVNRVSDRARPTLELFQAYCADVLYEHFQGRQETYSRATVVYLELHQKRNYLRGLQKQLNETELGQEIATLKKEIRTLETEQAGLDLEMFGKQLDLLTPSPTV